MTTVLRATLDVRALRVPVGLTLARDRDAVAFRELHAPCGTPVTLRTTCPEHGEVPPEELTKAIELAPGQFAPIDADELAALTPEPSRTIELVHFVRFAEVDPIYLDRAYYLEPTGPLAPPSYRVLVRALRRTRLAGIGRFTAWGNEHVALVRAIDLSTLLLHTLYVAGEIRSSDWIRSRVAGRARATERYLAIDLVRSLERPFDPQALASLTNGHHAHRRAIAAKLLDAAGDLELLLRRSLEQVGSR